MFESFSGGTELRDRINQDAVRLMKQRYGIDMEQTQHSKLITELPEIDIVVKMGCNVQCPFLPAEEEHDWGLDDPSGKSDEEFMKTIDAIEIKIKELAERLGKEQ